MDKRVVEQQLIAQGWLIDRMAVKAIHETIHPWTKQRQVVAALARNANRRPHLVSFVVCSEDLTVAIDDGERTRAAVDSWTTRRVRGR